MGNLIDLTGQTFGRLKVIERGPDYISPKGEKDARWWCECSCGNPNRVLISGKGMRFGRVHSCGCWGREVGKNNKKDLTGRVFGKLTVIEQGDYKTSKSGRKHIQWRCRCECGREIQTTTGCLTGGNTQSCGHCKYENQYEFHDDYIVGYTNTGDTFIIDHDDFDLISPYYWRHDDNPRHGYIETFIGHKRMPMHRLIMKAVDDDIIDHINHDTTDNRKTNLRKVTALQNSINRKRRSDNVSGHTGVCFHNCRGRKHWEAYITVDKKRMNLGRYLTKEEAIEARREAEIKYFGEYAFQTGNEMVPRVERTKKSEAA